MIPRVFDFNERIVQIPRRPLAPLSPDEKDWLRKALTEEVVEFIGADSVVDQVDALLDLVIFALGGLYRLGLTEDQALACFGVVMDANFTKKAGQKLDRAVGAVPDAIKPVGFLSPESRIARILNPGFNYD